MSFDFPPCKIVRSSVILLLPLLTHLSYFFNYIGIYNLQILLRKRNKGQRTMIKTVIVLYAIEYIVII